MSQRRLHGALVVAIALMLAAPATAAPPGGWLRRFLGEERGDAVV